MFKNDKKREWVNREIKMKRNQSWGEQFTETMKKLNKKEQKTFINDLTRLFKKKNEELEVALNDQKRKRANSSSKDNSNINSILNYNLDIKYQGEK